MRIATADLPGNLQMLFDGELLLLDKSFIGGGPDDVSGSNGEILPLEYQIYWRSAVERLTMYQ